MRPSRPLLYVLVPLALTLSACGGGDATDRGDAAEGRAPAPGDTRAELAHIHGLGVDPGSGTLFVATHYGLFQAPTGERKLEKIGESRQDIMGFSVVGAGRYIGSGHPDPSQNLPPNLGLIESRDDGKTWRNVSLLGEADFHVLRSAGRQVYGFNGVTGKLMVSSDGGRQWTERTPPAPLFDLAIDPADSERVLVSTEDGVFVSESAGDGWRPLVDDAAGLLAWPTDDTVFLVDGQGQVSRSTDAGRTFDLVGSVGGQPSAFASHDEDLYAALPDGSVMGSADGGANWTVRATP